MHELYILKKPLSQSLFIIMIPYRSRKSTIESYDIGEDYIIILFKDGNKHKYTYALSGKTLIEKMKHHARFSDGLSTFLKLYQPKFEILNS